MTTITYYDLASEYYLAYALHGLLTEARAHGCKIRISKEPPSLLKDIVLLPKDSERLFALGIFQVSSGGGRTQWFCIDAHDDSSTESYFRSVLENVDHYFKLNCNPAALGQDADLRNLEAKIRPLGCSFGIRPAKPWLFLPRIRHCKQYAWGWFSIKRRLLALQRNPSMEWLRNLRSQEADKDVFWFDAIIWKRVTSNPIRTAVGYSSLSSKSPECPGSSVLRELRTPYRTSFIGMHLGQFVCLVII